MTFESNDPATALRCQQLLGPKTVVVVDDESSMRDYLNNVLSREGYRCECFPDAMAALSYICENQQSVNLVLTDISMPGMDGLELLSASRALYPDLPVILLSGLCQLQLALDALNAGATDYLLKPATPGDIAEQVSRHLQPEGKRQDQAVREALRNFVAVRSRRGRALEQLQGLFRVLGFKDCETLQHCRRVASYAALLGEAYGLSGSELREVELGALLHDIGKIAVPMNVLLKPGPLTEEEWSAIRLHPSIGWELLSEFPDLKMEAQIVYCHHEAFDGSGYPRRLRGEKIPIAARIFSVIDTFDAITSNRPYRRAREFRHAREEISRVSGTQLDPQLTQIFADLSDDELLKVKETYKDQECLALVASHV